MVVLQFQLVAGGCSFFLNQGLLVVFLLLLVKDGLEELITRDAVHVENCRRDNVFYLGFWHVVQQVPVGVVHVLVLDSSGGVLCDVGHLLPVSQLVKEHWIVLLD